MKLLLTISLYLAVTISLYSFQLDDLLKDNLSNLSRSSINDSHFSECRYKREIISYDQSLLFLAHPVKEVVLRFTNQDAFESADITVCYETQGKNWGQIKKQADSISEELNKLLKVSKTIYPFHFPNGRVINVQCWNCTDFCVRTFCHLANYPNSGELSFFSVRIQVGQQPLGNLMDILRVTREKVKPISHYGGVLLPTPMRKQLDGLGGCWFTTLTRQINFLGSEIMPLMLHVGISNGEREEINKIGYYCRFKYVTFDINEKQQADKNCIQFISLYNQKATVMEVSPIKYEQEKDVVIWQENMNDIDLSLAKSLRLNSIFDWKYAKFRKMVIDTINNGYPIGWSVTRHSGNGKHRRMIVGYNLQKDMIYYSDSWGNRDNLNEIHFLTAYLMSVWIQVVCYL